MPLTKGMRKAKAAMEKRYGKKKGEQIYYAWEQKKKKTNKVKRKHNRKKVL